MLPIVVFGLLLTAGLALTPMVGLETDEPTEPDDPVDPIDPMDPADPTDPTDPTAPTEFFIDTQPTLTGSEGDDTITLSDTAIDTTAGGDFLTTSLIEAGAGNDIINLLDPAAATPPGEFEGPLFSGTIDAGDGDDTITAQAPEGVSVLGGAGNDTMTIFNGYSGTYDGGDGNDTITVEANNSDPSTVFGRAGDDVIDASEMDNAGIFGGEGNDTILLTGGNQPGAGYVIAPDGGNGNDTLIYTGTPFPDTSVDPLTMVGGLGEDIFQINTNQGGPLSIEDIPDGATAVPIELVNIGDFVSGDDSIVIDADVTDPAFTVGDITLMEDTGAGTTQIILPYTSETDVDRDVIITVNAIGLLPTDIVILTEDAA